MINGRPQLLFIGDLWFGSNALSLAEGFEQSGAVVTRIDTTGRFVPTLTTRLMPESQRRRRREDDAQWLKRSLADLPATTFDFAVCFKTVHAPQHLLLEVSAARKLHYSPDDAVNPDNITHDYLAYEHEWDCIYTTKQHNVPELQARGARRVEFVLSAYDPAVHKRDTSIEGTEPYRVGFIGAWRPDRRWLPDLFAEVAPSRGVIFGPRWRRKRPVGPLGVKIRPFVGGAAFLSSSAQFTVTPVLLNSENRDTHTCRTFEAPAAGNLCLFERTEEHAQLFDDGQEALFFSTRDELVERLKEVSSWPHNKVSDMATRGQRRVSSGHHTYRDRATHILEQGD